MLKTVIMAESAPLPPPSPTDAVFTSTHSALKFAFNFTHGTVQKNILDLSNSGNGRGLAGLDGAAQAGMVLGEIDRLSILSRNLLRGRYGVRTNNCSCKAPCCNGYRVNGSWGEAVDYLAEYLLLAELHEKIWHQKLRRALIIRYFDVKQPFTEIATSCGLKRDTASNYYKRVVEHLRKQERHAFVTIDARLQAVGIVIS